MSGNYRHGYARVGSVTKIYKTWQRMRNRCENEASPDYADYGGRGITVCPEWASFERFLADMGDVPEGKTLDRRKNHEGYSKDNCRWATALEQAQNKRNNRYLTYKGETLCLNEWSRRTGLNRLTIWGRLDLGWSVDRALSTPVDFGRNRTDNVMLTFQGETLCAAEWARRMGVSRTCIRGRIKAGWSVERTLTTPSLRS